MPTIALFYGISIQMFYNDHLPPHFHASYGGDTAEISIESGEIIEGSLPRPALRLVREWLDQRRSLLAVNWDRARAHEPLDRIEGLE